VPWYQIFDDMPEHGWPAISITNLLYTYKDKDPSIVPLLDEMMAFENDGMREIGRQIEWLHGLTNGEMEGEHAGVGIHWHEGMTKIVSKNYRYLVLHPQGVAVMIIVVHADYGGSELESTVETLAKMENWQGEYPMLVPAEDVE